MKKILLLTIIVYFAQVTHAAQTVFMKIKDMTCEQLATASKDPDFTLNSLAGIRGLKNCKDFGYDWKTIPDTERRLYQLEIQELNPFPTAQDELASMTVDELKKKIKKEKNAFEKIALMKQLRAKYKTNGKKTEALNTVTDIYNFSFKSWKKDKKNVKFQELLLESGLLLGRQFWSNNNSEKAEEKLNLLARNLKGQQNLIEVYFLQGRIHEEKESYETAVNFYDLVLEEFKKNPPKNLSFNKDKILWIKAWILYKTEKWSLAEQAFKNFANDTVELAEKSRAHFFQARSIVKQNPDKSEKKEEAKKLLTLVTQEDFYSYYALLAYQEMGQKIPAFKSLKSSSKFVFDPSLSFLASKNKEIFLALIKNEEIDLAERSVMFFADKPEQSTLMGLYLADKANRYLPLFAGFAKLSNEQKQDVLIQNAKLLYPKVYQPEVKEMASLTGLPTSLIYSIMKQESAFNMNTRSPANAYGLMQVIPELAKKLAKKYKLEYKTADDLYNPQTNIKIGSFELSEQVKKQNDQYTFVAAAYNAGPSALARWLKTKWKPQFDVVDFIEEIPYDETRLYVKVIARNHLFYDRLENPDKELDFPEKFIKKNDLVSQN